MKVSSEGQVQIDWLNGQLRGFEQILPLEPLSLEDIQQYVHSDDFYKLQKGMQVLMAGEIYQTQLHLTPHGHPDLWIEAISRPMKNPLTSKVEGFLGSLRDVTHRVEAQQERQQLASTLLQRNQELQQFAYITSHNLRAPVMNLLSLLEFLDREDPHTPSYREVLEKVTLSVQRLNETLEDLLEIVDLRDRPRKRIGLVDLPKTIQETRFSIGEQLAQNYAVVEMNLKVKQLSFSITYTQRI